MKIHKISAGAMLSLLTIGVLALPYSNQAQASVSSDLGTRVANLETGLATAYTDLTSANQELVYSNRYNDAVAALDTAETAVNNAKAAVPYVLFANVSEKATMYASLQSVMGQLLVYEKNVKDINANTSLTTAEKMTQLTTQLNAILTYLNANKTDFTDSVVAVLKNKESASLVYDQVGITALTETYTSYSSLAGNATLLKALQLKTQTASAAVKNAQAAYTAAEAQTDPKLKVKDYNRAAVRLTVAEAALLSAQRTANSLQAQNIYSPTYVTPSV